MLPAGVIPPPPAGMAPLVRPPGYNDALNSGLEAAVSNRNKADSTPEWMRLTTRRRTSILAGLKGPRGVQVKADPMVALLPNNQKIHTAHLQTGDRMAAVVLAAAKAAKKGVPLELDPRNPDSIGDAASCRPPRESLDGLEEDTVDESKHGKVIPFYLDLVKAAKRKATAESKKIHIKDSITLSHALSESKANLLNDAKGADERRGSKTDVAPFGGIGAHLRRESTFDSGEVSIFGRTANSLRSLQQSIQAESTESYTEIMKQRSLAEGIGAPSQVSSGSLHSHRRAASVDLGRRRKRLRTPQGAVGNSVLLREAARNRYERKKTQKLEPLHPRSVDGGSEESLGGDVETVEVSVDLDESATAGNDDPVDLDIPAPIPSALPVAPVERTDGKFRVLSFHEGLLENGNPRGHRSHGMAESGHNGRPLGMRSGSLDDDGKKLLGKISYMSSLGGDVSVTAESVLKLNKSLNHRPPNSKVHMYLRGIAQPNAPKISFITYKKGNVVDSSMVLKAREKWFEVVDRIIGKRNEEEAKLVEARREAAFMKYIARMTQAHDVDHKELSSMPLSELMGLLTLTEAELAEHAAVEKNWNMFKMNFYRYLVKETQKCIHILEQAADALIPASVAQMATGEAGSEAGEASGMAGDAGAQAEEGDQVEMGDGDSTPGERESAIHTEQTNQGRGQETEAVASRDNIDENHLRPPDANTSYLQAPDADGVDANKLSSMLEELAVGRSGLDDCIEEEDPSNVAITSLREETKRAAAAIGKLRKRLDHVECYAGNIATAIDDKMLKKEDSETLAPKSPERAPSRIDQLLSSPKISKALRKAIAPNRTSEVTEEVGVTEKEHAIGQVLHAVDEVERQMARERLSKVKVVTTSDLRLLLDYLESRMVSAGDELSGLEHKRRKSLGADSTLQDPPPLTTRTNDDSGGHNMLRWSVAPPGDGQMVALGAARQRGSIAIANNSGSHTPVSRSRRPSIAASLLGRSMERQGSVNSVMNAGGDEAPGNTRQRSVSLHRSIERQMSIGSSDAQEETPPLIISRRPSVSLQRSIDRQGSVGSVANSERP